jgi:unsaturated chondroitin disaccharide hydrolase
MKINASLTPQKLQRKIARLWELSAAKIRSLESYDTAKGSPVFTVRGKYTARGWTEWTQGFQYGSAILQHDAEGSVPPEHWRNKIAALMTPHVSHFGVHDHGFNNVSTYGNLLRLMNEGRIPENAWERSCYELALKVSGAVQARRWTKTADGGGFIYSFNGPHSLFVDSIRSLRSLAVAHKLSHALLEENDRKVSLFDRLKQHAVAVATYNVRAGGQVAHETIFNVNDGNFRCPNSQQGWSGFTTWTRGLAWAMLGFAEQLEFARDVVGADSIRDRSRLQTAPTCGEVMLKAAKATCDFYIEHATAADGIPYWDTGAPNLHKLGNWQSKPSKPFNDFEPVDSSAAAIAAQGLLRLGHYLGGSPESRVRSPQSKDSRLKTQDSGLRYWQAGLTVLDTLLDEPYLSTDSKHQGLILHSVYHCPNGWDYIPRGCKVPCGESSMWGDYHAREVALYVQRIANNERYLTFWG